MFGCGFFYLHVDVFILVWGRASGAYLLFQHVQHCVVVGYFGLLGFCFLNMATLHFSLVALVDCTYFGHFLLQGFSSDGGCNRKSFGALSIGVVDIGLGMVARWVDV